MEKDKMDGKFLPTCGWWGQFLPSRAKDYAGQVGFVGQ
jgi:hypothetical protein